MNVEKTLTGNKIYGMVSGIVRMANSDGTYKVWIPGVYDSEYYPTPEDLPNAKLLYPPFGGDVIDCSFGGPLLENTRVFCFFDNGEITKPIIFGKYHSEETYQELATQNQNNLNRQFCIKNKNSKIAMRENGEIELLVFPNSDMEINPVSKISIDSSGNLSICGNTITIDATNSLRIGARDISMYSTYDILLSTLKNIVTKCTSVILGYVQVVKAVTIHLRIPRTTILAGYGNGPYEQDTLPEIDDAHVRETTQWYKDTMQEIEEAKQNGTYTEHTEENKQLVEENIKNLDVVQEAEFMREFEAWEKENGIKANPPSSSSGTSNSKKAWWKFW